MTKEGKNESRKNSCVAKRIILEIAVAGEVTMNGGGILKRTNNIWWYYMWYVSPVNEPTVTLAWIPGQVKEAFNWGGVKHR